MTRYDPFAYGQVKLADGKDAPPADPDDLLFADAGPMRQAANADASWALMNEDVSSLLPGSPPEAFAAAAAEFGQEILGEGRTMPVAPKTAATPAPRARARAASPAARGGPVPTMPAPAPVVASAPQAAPNSQKTASVRPATPKRLAPLPGGPRRARGPLSLLLPLAIVAAGGCGGAWFLVMQQNPIMGGIVAACAAVGGLFTWLLLRG